MAFDLRREPTLREARSWFLLDFHPRDLAEFVAAISGERNASIRMVLGYWDMAASLVTSGAIDRDAFLAAHSEVFGTFSKIHTLLAELRAATNEPTPRPATLNRLFLHPSGRTALASLEIPPTASPHA